MGKKLSGIHFGQRVKQSGQSDIDILIRLNQFLWDKFGMAFKREWYMLFERDGSLNSIRKEVTLFEAQLHKIRNPDLIYKGKNGKILIIEVDGNAHKHHVSRTLDRNHDYILAGIDYIIVDLPDLKFLKMTPEQFLTSEVGHWKTINGLG